MLISIIIPTYNGEKTLRRCLDSCVRQTYQEIEIIVVNDGSIDNSRAIIEEYQQVDHRVRIVNKQNEGLILARRTGVNLAKGEYVFFIDCDDYLVLDAIELLAQQSNDGEYDIVAGALRLVYDNGAYMSTCGNEFVLNKENAIYDLLSKNLSPTISGRLLKRELFCGVNFDPQYTIGEDVTLSLQILLKKPKIAILNKEIYYYVQYSDSMINSGERRSALARMRYIDFTCKFIDAYESDNNDVDKAMLSNAMSWFLLNEYYSFLRDGGNKGDNMEVTRKVFSEALKNNWACRNSETWRIIMFRLYYISPLMGGGYLNMIKAIRELRKTIKNNFKL